MGKRVLVFVVLAAGCQADDPPPDPEADPADRPAALRRVADDPRANRSDRAAAVFALFGDHLAPPCQSSTAGRALGEAGWLEAATLDPIQVLAGWIPVEFGFDDSVYCLRLFPRPDGWSEWVIYLGLSGAPDHPEEVVRAFLRGGTGVPQGTELVEYALCYPSPKGEQHNGRIERFGPGGLRVYDFDKSD
jgi:hypothetical protein